MASPLSSLSPAVQAALLVPVGVFALYKFLRWIVPGTHRQKALSFKGKTVLITGASSGLGEALAKELYRRGARLILVARSIDKLKELTEALVAEGGGLYEPKYAYLDLADPHKIEDLVKLSHDGKIDVLINNAGMSMRGSVMETDMKVHRQVMEINYFGQISVTRALLPYIPDDGAIVVTTSVQAKIAIPYRSAYSGSKHAVQAFFDSLRSEERFGLQILTVAAGYINTNLGHNALDASGKPTGKSDAHLLKGMQPEVAARRIANATERREIDLVLAPLHNRIGIFLRWFWPSFYFYSVYKRGQSERQKKE